MVKILNEEIDLTKLTPIRIIHLKKVVEAIDPKKDLWVLHKVTIEEKGINIETSNK